MARFSLTDSCGVASLWINTTRMKNVVILLIFGLFAANGLHAQQREQRRDSSQNPIFTELRPLSPAEADAIIQGRVEKREQREAQRLINRVNFTVLERKEVSVGNRKVILNRVVPPNLPPDMRSIPQSEPVQLSEAELEELIKSQEKPHLALFLSATVYDRKLTKLRWYHDGQEFVVWSNVDFNYFTGIADVETEDAHYSILMGLGNENTKSLRERKRHAYAQGRHFPESEDIPELPPFTRGRAEYFFIADRDETSGLDDAFAAIDAVHSFYEENKRELHIAHQRREALREAKLRYEAANPEEPKDTVIHFWPKRGSSYQNKK